MQKIKIERAKLLAEVKKNRTAHEKAYKESMIGYQHDSIEELKRMLADASAGKDFLDHTGLDKPVSYLKDYDRIIRQLELSSEKIIELNEQEFNQYVMDEWGWKQSFTHLNTMYSKSISH